MRFVAIDVETANADMASICSIGVAVFENGVLASEWYSLIDPDDFFDPVNTSIHGITEADVQGARTFKDIAADIERFLGSQVVVTHTHISTASQCTKLQVAGQFRRRPALGSTRPELPEGHGQNVRSQATAWRMSAR